MTMIDVRQDERVRSFLRARILFNNHNTTVECIVKNISASGAKIDVNNSISIPSEFDLDIPQKGKIYRAKMMWRDTVSIGVSFVEAVAEPAAEGRSRDQTIEARKPKAEDTVGDAEETTRGPGSGRHVRAVRVKSGADRSKIGGENEKDRTARCATADVTGVLRHAWRHWRAMWTRSASSNLAASSYRS